MAILLSYPIGQLWARLMPNKTIFGVRLNPGPFTVKEHVIVTIMASVGGKYSYAVSEFERFVGVELIVSLDRHRCCPTSILQSRIQLHLSMDASDIDTTHWFLNRRHFTQISGNTTINE